MSEVVSPETGTVLNVKAPFSKGGNEGGINFETRRSDLKPVVRDYADRLYAAIKKIYARYGVTSVAELHAKIAAGQKPRGLKPGELKSDAKELSSLVENLKSALEKNAIPEGEGIFVLHDVPSFSGFPSESVLIDKNTGYKFDWIWKSEYREGRDRWDFWPDEDAWLEMGLDDPVLREELIQEIADAHNHNEKEREAKVFDIGETLAKKRTEDPDHPDSLTNKEVFEAIDQAGYRPATLEELLAFGKECWQPEADQEALTDEEKARQRLKVASIYALGSPFAGNGGGRYVPYLGWNGEKRSLSGYSLSHDWFEDARFLIVRKASS